MKKKLLQIPVLYIVLILIWGSTWIAIKVSVGEAPFIMAAIRFFLASGLLVTYQLIRRKPLLPPRSHARVIVALGIGNFFIGYGFTYWGMQYVNSNITSILWATLPVQVSVFAHFMLKDEKINFSNVFSLVGALIGSYLIFDVHGQSVAPQAALGMAVILVSIFGSTYSNVLYKREGSHLDPVNTNAAAMLIGACLLFVSGLILEPWEQIEFTLLNLGATAYLALFGSAIGFSMYFWLLKHVTVVKMSYTTFLIPILAIFWGWVLLGESLSPLSLTGAVIILLSVALPESGPFKCFQARRGSR
ncbi:MAG: EamA family transporter [Candidatus Marinimicrobia bacterium]|nr:EamA family transporter [Candidatus Neomarinimicrobiota bacterium]